VLTAVLGEPLRDALSSSGPGSDQRWAQACWRARDLAEMAAAKRQAGTTVDAADLALAAYWVAAVAPDWQSMSGRTPTERTWRTLVDEPDLQGWLICWPAGRALDLHDHGGAAGAMVVLGGTLEEHAAAGPGEPIERRLLPEGTASAFGPSFIHSVCNPCRPLVTSVHLYSRAFGEPIGYLVGADGTAQLKPAAAERLSKPAKG
jgi:hypothetical protein